VLKNEFSPGLGPLGFETGFLSLVSGSVFGGVFGFFK